MPISSSKAPEPIAQTSVMMKSGRRFLISGEPVARAAIVDGQRLMPRRARAQTKMDPGVVLVDQLIDAELFHVQIEPVANHARRPEPRAGKIARQPAHVGAGLAAADSGVDRRRSVARAN